jgi:very-short-patch-repair endonuclease
LTSQRSCRSTSWSAWSPRRSGGDSSGWASSRPRYAAARVAEAHRLCALLSRDTAPAFTRSEAERRLLSLVRAAALPAPDHNLRIAGHERDLVWFEQGLVVETDGWEHHRSRAAFESDRARDAALLAHGLRTMRVTWRQLTEAPEAVVARLAQALVSRE